MQRVFLIMSLCVFFFSFLFCWNILAFFTICLTRCFVLNCICVRVCNCRSMHMFHTACMLMLVHESIMSDRHFKRTAISLLSTRGTKEQSEAAFTQVSTRYSFHSIITELLISSHCDAAHSWASRGFSVFITQHNPTNYGMNGKFEPSKGL